MSERAKPQLRAVYTDGACSGNPGPGGWAWAVDHENFASGFAQRTTNQRMEIQAAFEAIKALPGPLEVVSDSTYVVNCFKQRWWQGWLARGWTNSQKKPVANRDLWEPFIELVQRRGNVTFRWVKGHAGNELNDLADQLAVEATRDRRGRAGGLGRSGATGANSPPAAEAPESTSAHRRDHSPRPKREADAPAREEPPAPARVVYLVCGAAGAGKTTHATQLANERGAFRFSIDEWMRTLFAPDIVDNEYEWMLERVRRCEEQIWRMSLQALALGRDVVLDLGFATREHRRQFQKLALEAGARAAVHFVDVGPRIRRQRVLERNENRDPKVFSMQVTDEQFSFMEKLFEAPDEAELAGGQQITPRRGRSKPGA
jgi:ribonuclease HI/predicted kinase